MVNTVRSLPTCFLKDNDWFEVLNVTSALLRLWLYFEVELLVYVRWFILVALHERNRCFTVGNLVEEILDQNVKEQSMFICFT